MKLKTNFHFLPVLAMSLLAGCSQDDVIPNGNEPNGGANTSYLAVNLVSSDAFGSRAENGYQDGTSEENKVTSIRFYFFNEVGGVVNVKVLNGTKVNYYDWTPEEGEQTGGTVDDDDIESKLKATIVINTSIGDGIPQRIAAVMNPPTINGTSLLGTSSLNLTTLKEKMADFAASDLTSNGKFVMFNAVYASKDAQVSTVAIKNENLCKTQAAALANPVKIYVERNVAKVTVSIDDLGLTEGKIALKDQGGNPISIDGNQVYLKLDNWGLSAETSEGRLVKKINPTWAGTWWNDDYRSYWAINSMAATNQYHTFAQIGGTFGTKTSPNPLYTNENAQTTDINGSEGAAKNHTKVILKGQLCKSDGSPLTIVRHLGVKFVDDDNLAKLKESILSQLAASGYTYYSGDANNKTQISKDDLKIVEVEQEHKENSQQNCYVWAQLTEAAAAKAWYASADQTAPTIDYTTINDNLEDKTVVDRALVWKEGQTYYYYDIKHMENQIGVVRNHVYATNVTKIAGLGTPVYNPDVVIYPEKPDPNDHFIAAQINILSWRIVPNDYELEW